MGCVNKSSREFKSLMARHGLDSNALELIVHKYWIETGNEEYFPTDVYIQAQMGYDKYEEKGPNVRKLWEKLYSHPLVCGTMKELEEAKIKASQYFPLSAIRYIRDIKGNYIMFVQKPVAKIRKSKDSFFRDYDSAKSSVTLDLNIKEGQSYNVETLQNLYNRLNTDRTSKDLADRVFSIAKDLNLNIVFSETLPSGILGRYRNDNTITYRKSFLEGCTMNSLKAPVILHEMLHALSSYALSEQTEGWQRPELLEQFRTEMNSLYQDLKNNPILKEERGISNVKEFVAELANPVFRAKLQEIDKAKVENKPERSIWQRVLDAFRHLLNIHSSSSYYERSMNALDKALDAFDIDTYMRYNDLKNTFRKERVDNTLDTQYNQNLSVIDNAAKSGKWTPAALSKLNNLIKDIENGKVYYQRFPQEASRGSHQGGRANEVASLLLRTSESSSGENTRSFSEWQERNQREQPVQERILENWAKAAHIWHDNLDSIQGKRMLAEGGEAKVFYNTNEKKVTKILSTVYFGTPQFALDRITLHNTLFPEAPLEVTGFGRDSKGEFQFIVEQPFIQGEPATQEEIDRFITKMGFAKSSKDNGHTFVSDDLYLSDLHDENVIKTPKGTLIVIDADLRLNTPELGMDGKYQIDDSIVPAKEKQTKEFVKTLSPDQLREEENLIRQESDDYDLVNGVEEQQEKRKAVLQDITFADGVTVKSPFRPNAQQIEALNAMSDFIKSKDTSMTLSGYAGTGKTSLMEMIAQKCQKQHRPVMFCATTNKAAAVLNSRVSKAGFEATTLNKTFGINVEMDTNQKSYNARNLVNKLKDIDIIPGTTIIIDEASMINEENYRILNDIADDNRLKLIYVGDSAQLAPVKEDQISKVFRNGEGKVVTLTQVERTDDNAILKEATDIRNGKPLSGETSFNSKGEGVAYISPEHQKAIDEVISHYVKGLKKDPNSFRILAYTNKAVAAYNNKVRKLLGYEGKEPQKDEPMVGYNNWGYTYDPRAKQGYYRFINSESYKVTDVGKPKKVSTTLNDGTKVEMEALPLTLTDSMGKVDTFDYMDIKSNPQNRRAALLIANEKKNLWAMTRKVYGGEAKAKLYQKINDLDRFLFVNDDLEDNNHNLLQKKTIDFGYALTIHKSQGSTFTNVLMDDVDVSGALRSNGMSDAESVDLEGNSLDPSKDKLESAEDVDLGDLSDVVEEPQQTTKTSNLKQQLEYVGVSRATDTVTIISNNVKKEGSPLHPEKNLKDSTINPSNQRSDNTEPHQGFISDGARQLVDHLKSMGLNVLGKADMEKFFKEHPGMLVQMARAYGKEKPYLNSKYRKQKNEILDIVKSKKYDKPGTDAITLESEEHKTIYLIDHSANSELADNLKKGDGFGIRETFNVEKLSKDDCRRIIRNIAGDYGRSEVSIRRKLQNLGVRPAVLSGIDIAAELKMGTDVDAGLVLPGGREGFSLDNNRSGSDGRESKEGSRQKNRIGDEGVEFYMTPDGEVYGFVDKEGNIYLDETKINAEHPIHEYTHLWDRVVAQKNPELWNRGVELMKQTSLWQEVLNDDTYGRKWQALKGMTQDKLDSLIASEVHSRLTGKEGTALLAKLANEKGKSGIIDKLKQWILDFWKDLKATFSPWSKEDLDNLSLSDFANMTVRDFAEGINPLKVKDNVNINTNNNETEQYKSTDEFRRVQEAVRGSGKEASRGRSVFEGYLEPDQRQRLADILGRQLGAIDSFIHGSSRNVTNERHKTSFKVHSEVDPQLFHDIFEVVRYYTKNAELVDLHEDYSDCKCYLTEDGTAGFAIEPDGNLVSVFNLGTTKGFLSAVKDLVREAGATHLDAYASSKQNLEQMYQKTLGFYTAATMDYNMEYDHDDIAKNHGNPQVVFMVDHEVAEPKHFDKDSYDAAQQYLLDQLKETKVENPTTEEEQSFTVPLPNYEHINELPEVSTVDAEWKIPYLKELDDQLSDENDEEENKNIINQMDNVFQAISLEEYLQNRKANSMEKQLDEYEKLIQQFDNLLEGGDADYHEIGAAISAAEVRHTAELIVNSISDEITRLQKEEGRAKEIFPTLNTSLDFQNATRREIVEAVGINRLIDRAKNLFTYENNYWDDTDVILQAALIVDNWDAMMMLASDIFAFNEGFGITKDFTKGNFTTTEGSKTDYDNFNDYSNDEDINAEEGGKDEQEHWQIESKTIDVLNSMSALVRQGIHECYLLDENGQKVMSKWGIAERVNPRNAVNSILRWTQGSLSLNDMIKHLSDKQARNPWLSQLINRLSDQSGKETDFQSQFYSVFSKHFQTYSIVLQEDGKYHSMIVNSHPALSEAMNTITALYKIGEHPLFTAKGINKKALGNEDTTGKDADFNLHKALYEMREITKSLNQGNTLNDEMSRSASDNIMGVCRLLGYNITEDLLTDVVNAETIKKETMYLGYIVKCLDKALAAMNRGKLKEYRPFTYGAENGIDGSVRNFLTPITDKLEDTAVSAFYDSGKMYQSYVTPSFMSKLMKKFKQSGQAFQDFMMEEYGNSEWFAFNKFGDYNRIQWRNEWLRLLARNVDARKVFDHKVELNFNKHNYMRNMSDAEYTLSLITEYFSESTDTGSNMVPAWYRVPMQSNKPSSDFIKFYSDRSGGYKDNITHNLYSMFLQELSRIQTVRMRNLSKKDPGFIKNFDTNGRKFCFFPVFNAYLENTPANIAKRKSLHNGVDYDAEKLYSLQNKEDIWKREAKDYNEWEHQYVSQKLDEDVFYDKEKDPVIQEERGKVKASQLTMDEDAELRKLREQKKADERKLSTEEDNRFASLLQKKLNGEEALTAEEEVVLSNLANKIIYQFTNNRIQSILASWENSGIIDAAMNIKNIFPSDLREEESLNWTKRQVENFLWNDALASKNILQLTLTDIAFYKDTEDLQKRLAQLHAPGNRGRKDAVDYNGRRVSDGKYRTTILSDFDSFKSNIIANISEVFDRKIVAAPANQKAQMQALKESLVGENGKYTKINVTDAQGFSSPSSYRKKAFIFGRWSHQAEDIYQKLMKGEYNFSDLETAFQPLKPFVYSKLTKDLGVSNAPIHSMQVPFQAKNAEYLLIMADAILKGEQLSRPNLLRAVYRVMEDSEKINPTMGIDTVQFESAIKSGLQGKMNIYQFRDMEGGEEAAYTYMMRQIYKSNDNGELTKEYNTDTFVHETSYDDYCLQQEVPEHFKEHSQAHGSQIRMITPSDLDLYTTDENGNQVDNFYEWTEPNGEHKKLKADEFRKEYEQTIAANIEQSINDLAAELHFNSRDKKERNFALSKILQREILSSPRYGVDLIQACAIDRETGDFRIPKGDPIQAKRIEQLINSIIKNRVNKQKIAGGPIVQVSNFGTSRQLHIRFNDKQGNLMPLEEEYNPSEHDNLSYKDYIKKHQGGIAYFEVFAPVWSNELVKKFSNPDGTINMEAIEAVDPELLKMVSYRIPTEDKYSCAPMKVVGFMPREAGDAIMLPYELTEIDGSDFDVDKRYVMRKDIPIKTKRRGEIEKHLFTLACESYKKAHKGQTRNGYIKEQVKMFMDNPQKMKNVDSLMRALWKAYQSFAYYTEAPTSGRTYRNNKIIDMTYAVLTNQMTADKILNPGGFDAPKRMGYMVAAYKNPANNVSWEDLQKMSIDELKDLSYTDKDLTFADTQVQFYKQNAAAASLIGVFAVNKVAHATLESNDIYLDVSEVCGEDPFTIINTTFGGRMQIDGKYDQAGTLIGKTLGSLVSASADAVKDPILNLMNINMTTAGMLNTMLRLGMTFEDAALFLSQDIIERTLSQFNRENLSNYVTLNSLIDKWLDTYRQKYSLNDSSVINTEPLTKEELVEGLTANDHGAIDYKVLLAFKKLRSLTDVMRKPTYATRFNSISSAVGPLIIDNLIMEHKMNAFLTSNDEDISTHFYTADGVPVDIDDIFADHPVLKQFSRTVEIAKQMFLDMPTGSNQFRGLLEKLPTDISEKMYNDKKLLDQFSNFYQSYLLIQSGVVNPAHLKDYTTGFAKWFIDQNFKEKYPTNALIQAIRMQVSNKSKRPYLTINITGMDEQQKEEWKNAWVDLHKEDPELSKMLFDYNFFRAGIGFSPKTFMSLVPTYVKMRLKSKDGSATYVDTYRDFPDINKDIVIDQFIRNNWDNNKLVPWRGGKDTKYNVDLKHGRLSVYRPEDKKALQGISYMKTFINKATYLWHYVGDTATNDMLFERIKPLGNNGEYLEMDVNKIVNPLSETIRDSVSQSKEDMADNTDNDTSDLKESAPQETDAEAPSTPVVSETETVKDMSAIADLIQKQVPKLSHEEAEAKANEIKNGNIRQYRKFLQNVFKQKGLTLNEEEAINEFNKYC